MRGDRRERLHDQGAGVPDRTGAAVDDHRAIPRQAGREPPEEDGGVVCEPVRAGWPKSMPGPARLDDPTPLNLMLLHTTGGAHRFWETEGHGAALCDHRQGRADRQQRQPCQQQDPAQVSPQPAEHLGNERGTRAAGPLADLGQWTAYDRAQRRARRLSENGEERDLDSRTSPAEAAGRKGCVHVAATVPPDSSGRLSFAGSPNETTATSASPVCTGSLSFL